MGTELSADDRENTAHQHLMASHLLRRLPWLDNGTATLVAAIAADLASEHPEVIAVMLFGSVARHEERSLSHHRPSDVDLLVLVNASAKGDPLSLNQRIALHHTIGEREYIHADSALAVQAILATNDLAGWDDLFIANVAQDGVLLWARRPLPKALSGVVARGAVFTLDELTV